MIIWPRALFGHMLEAISTKLLAHCLAGNTLAVILFIAGIYFLFERH